MKYVCAIAFKSNGPAPTEKNVMADRQPTSDTLHHFLRTRRSIRRFRPEPVPQAVLRRVLETAVHAPSAHNLQPWRFVLIQDEAARQRLGRALTDKMRADMQAEGAPQDDIESRVTRSLRRIAEAPVLLLFCRDTAAVRVDTPEEHCMGTQSVANAVTTLLLAAHAEGLGANWICWPLYAPSEVRSTLSLPPTWTPEGMLFLGYPAEEPAEKGRRSVEEVVLGL